MLDLRRLRYFVAIDRCGSMVLASRQLGIAQPALSRHMRELEALVGFQLLERLPRGVRTTDAGQILLHHAKLVVAQVDEAEGAIRSFAKAKGRMRTVKLSLLPSWSTSFTPAIFTAVAAKLPNVLLQIVEARHEESIRLINSREVDLEIDGQDTVKRAVIAGIGDSILSWNSVKVECESGLLSASPIVDPEITRTVVLRKAPSIDVETFERLRDILREIARTEDEPKTSCQPPE
jgi:DNA-binding transcriptional LysR family regulator